METQDSLDIAKLQRVALGLVCNDLQRSRLSHWANPGVFRSTNHPNHSFPSQRKAPALRRKPLTTTLPLALMVAHRGLPTGSPPYRYRTLQTLHATVLLAPLPRRNMHHTR